MNPFSSRRTLTVDLPFDPGQSATLRALSGRQLGKAQEASQFESVESLKRMGGPAFQKELSTLGSEEERAAQVAKFKADPLNAYDQYLLCEKGILSWSYSEAVSAETIDDLDEDAVTWFAREILKLSKPSLFQTKDEAEAARGNVSGASIAP